MDASLTFIDAYKVLAMVGDGGQAKYSHSLFLVCICVVTIWNCMLLRCSMLAWARAKLSIDKLNFCPFSKNITIWLKCIMLTPKLLSQMLMVLRPRNPLLYFNMLKMETSLNIFQSQRDSSLSSVAPFFRKC